MLDSCLGLVDLQHDCRPFAITHLSQVFISSAMEGNAT
jgi:hypothetical protein